MRSAVSFPVPISDRAGRAIAWLERHAPGRYMGWCVDADGMFAVDILRPGSDQCDRYRGETLEDALAKARAAIRSALGATVKLRRLAPARLLGFVRLGEPVPFAIERALAELDP
jgi:hypothetical protein